MRLGELSTTAAKGASREFVSGVSAHLFGGGKGQLYPRKNSQLGPCSGMSLVGERTWKVLNWVFRGNRGQGTKPYKVLYIESPVHNVSAAR